MEGKIRADWVSTRVMGGPKHTYAKSFSGEALASASDATKQSYRRARRIGPQDALERLQPIASEFLDWSSRGLTPKGLDCENDNGHQAGHHARPMQRLNRYNSPEGIGVAEGREGSDV
jgi:hypothetical protein